MQRLGVCLLALVLAGCTGSSKPVAGRPTAMPQESVAATPGARVSSSPASLACRLPIVEYAQQAQGLVPTRGFLTVPGGQFTADPNGGFVQDGNNYHSSARPHLNGGGAGAGAYAWPLQRWLPVELRSVSPDGAHYAYQNSSGIHDVEVATGKDRILAGSSGVDTVLYYAKEGIYFNHGAWEGPPGPGLWLIDPATGKIQTVFTDKSVDTVGGFAAWLPAVNPADPHPLHSSYSGGPLPNQATRRDLNGGATVPWFYQPGKFLTVVGFDQERRPLINVSYGESVPGINEIWLVSRANQGTRIFTGPELPRIVGDSHGIWLSDKRGIWLYTTSQGLVQIATIAADVAGKCA